MNQFKIYSGPVAYLASGTAISYSGNPIEIVYGPNESPWRLVFHFLIDNGKNERVEPVPSGETSLEMRLYNFFDALGSGTELPLEIGKLNGRVVSLHFRVYPLANSDYTCSTSIRFEGWRQLELQGPSSGLGSCLSSVG